MITAWAGPEDCGQACHYLRANEVLLLQVKYQFKKVLDLGNMDPATRMGELGAFCKAQAQQSGQSLAGRNTSAECWKSYLLVSKRSFQAIRRSMAINYDSAERLGSKRSAALPFRSTGGPQGKQAPSRMELYVDLSVGGGPAVSVPTLPELEKLDPVLSRFSNLLRARRTGGPAQAQALDQELSVVGRVSQMRQSG